MPRLFVVPTPIGNLEDITLRALRVLGEVAVVYAEDTRHTRKLMSHFHVSTPLKSYHQHNKRESIGSILTLLQERDVALVSAAGMPAISDPGFELISAAVAAGVEIDVLPGASAVITAVVAAALPASGFLFLGFLPRRQGERRKRLESVRNLPFSLVLYEAPHRLIAALHDLQFVLGDRHAVVARELTKVHQEFARGSISWLLERFASGVVRGECTLVVAGSPEPQVPVADAEAELLRRKRAGEDRQSAIASVSREYGAKRNALYRAWLRADPHDDSPASTGENIGYCQGT